MCVLCCAKPAETEIKVYAFGVLFALEIGPQCVRMIFMCV